MQLHFVQPRVGDSWITFLLREGYTLDGAFSRLGALPGAAPAADPSGRSLPVWNRFAVSFKRGLTRLGQARQQQALRYIRRMRAQCGYRPLSVPDPFADVADH